MEKPIVMTLIEKTCILMNNKTRKIKIDELNLWKKATRNDIKLNSYLEEEETETKVKNTNKDLPLKRKKDLENINLLANEKKYKILNNNQTPQANKSAILKLKRGKIPVEAILDLHGYNKNNARTAVRDFIKNSISKNIRCVLIITGKKNSYFGANSVLRKNLPDWLKEEDLSYYLLAHCFASIKDGGDGARYVLLRKKEKI